MPGRRRGGEPKAAKRGTPIRNSLLLLVLTALLAALVILLPKEPTRTGAAVLVPGMQATGGQGTPENLMLRISEVMASNRRAYPDDRGNYSDWVEIENIGDESVNLQGIGLSDRDDRVLFLFPAMELAPGDFAVVFCDDTNAAEPGKPLHARFKISALGETLHLFDRNAVAFASLQLPALNTDMSYALSGKEWIVTEQYTPGYPNSVEGYEQFRSAAVTSAEGLALNELVASNVTTLQDEDGEYADWIELYNGGSLPVDLSNYALSDDEADPIKWRFPQGAVIEAGGYYTVFASGKDRPGGDGRRPHTNFRLSAEGETVILCDILSQVVDRVTYDNLEKDCSWGRVVGLDHTWQVYSQPTPGMANDHIGAVEMDRRMRAQNTSGVFLAEVVLSSLGTETSYGNTSYDFVKLVNRGSEPVNLTGWGLSDDVGRPRKWQFPNITLAPDQFILVFCSGLGKSPVSSSALHTTFRLSSLGESVVLSDPRGRILDKLVVPRLETGTSYGRDFDRGGLFYYDTPAGLTAANDGEGFPGYAQAPTIETAGCMYNKPMAVSITAPKGVTIRYTLDGSAPTEENSEVYQGPFEISRTVVLRARGFVEGLKPSEIDTQTYLYNVYHGLPVVSLTVDPNDLWNPLTGIYADGEFDPFTKVPFKQATYRVMKMDRSMRERAGNFEFFSDQGKQLVNQGVAVQLHGQFSLDIAQKSFRITAKNRYGSAALPYPFFEDRPFSQYKAVLLRNGGNDGSYARIVDALQSKIVDWTDSDIIHMASRPVIAYLNGEYWGQYNLRERINEHSIAAYEGWADPRKVDLIKGNDDVLNGSYDDYARLLDFVKKNDLNVPENLQKVRDWVDVDNYFDFMIFEMFFGNTDALNIKYYRQQAEGAKWRWVLFDLDWGYWFRDTDGCFVWLDPKGSGDKNGDNSLIRALLSVPEMQDKFLKRYGTLFQDYFSDTDRILALIDSMVAEIDNEMPLHFARWAGLTSKVVAFDPPSDPDRAYTYWKGTRINRLKNIVRARPAFVWDDVKDWFKLTDQQMTGYFGPRPADTEDIY